MKTESGKVVRVRKASVAERPPNLPEIAAASETKPAEGAKPAEGGRPARKPSGKNIRSLADLQKAIKQADRVKQNAQTQGKIGEMRRERDSRRKQKMTREERKQYRESKRLTVELSHSESRVKVDQQIGKFMKMIQLLEGEWQKGEEDRIKREKELEEQQKMFEKASSQMDFLSNALMEMSNQMEEMKNDMDSLTANVSKGVKKEEKWYGTQFANFQNNFLDMRHQAYVFAM
eukprot:CAMPEP_0117046738 /NCGR_PEP_ID=MMETSP0472-20121206/32315_1 /TAXON_ID=693140 ORGANISM="Tiarina fusus, Strain LIS" /NCGR_SAMPLE_ID=MMETSP0472 /ASSEMBLY_ACC=CAM_ASM_000603 /LENGTH=231 /DNA_ID=CAMNT_0004759201 /DNA_START=175 /DNA_END=867 /DNA_ORIENTATION=-